MTLTGFKSIGPAAATIRRNGAAHLVIAAACDADRAIAASPDIRVFVGDGLIDGLKASPQNNGSDSRDRCCTVNRW